MNKNKIVIYTDGAAKGNPGPAGWGAVLLMGKKIIELGGRIEHATNNQMELISPIEALLYLKKNKINFSSRHSSRQGLAEPAKVEIFSDSKYVILGITEWIYSWLKNNWHSANKRPVMNKELWERLYILNVEFKPKWSYIEGHANHKWNERADAIATSFAEGSPVRLSK